MTEDVSRYLPEDGCAGTLVARVWVPAEAGPAVALVTGDGVFDLSRSFPTVARLLDEPDPAIAVRTAVRGVRLGSVAELFANSVAATRDPTRPWLLAPIDLQAVKAAGVTFASSLLERVVEEQARGDPGRAEATRRALVEEIGSDLGAVRPGSPAAERLKASLIKRGLWSQYLEVGIGPDAEVFTKCQPLASVGFGADIGIHPGSSWNNPEPEIVVAVNSRGALVGATLGNDVNLRDVEGRSALLLSKAKDNNGSCAIGPLLRLLDASFTLDDIRGADLDMRVEGDDGFVMTGHSSMRMISRDVLDVVGQTIGAHHQYPDGFVLFMGTMFAPTDDRGAPGQGFTHKVGDVVMISTPKLGALVNRVDHSDRIAPWRFGVRALMENLAARRLLEKN
ncbi:MAG TPA: fumarylacetoacetate hydrolase family protein [Candidatus Sulfotelmatobacter sp.]|nr:fumarylacetoacetate hydrolase family protein [Candidatus Sulfotelmatobacter sp.]